MYEFTSNKLMRWWLRNHSSILPVPSGFTHLYYCLCSLGFVQELIFWIVHWTVFYDCCNTGLQIFSMESLSMDSSTHFSLPHYKLLFKWNPISYNMVHAISLSQEGQKVNGLNISGLPEEYMYYSKMLYTEWN